MRRGLVLAGCIALLLCDLRAAHALQRGILVIRGATVHTGTGQTLESATVIVKGGKISAIGADLEIPEGPQVQVIDATGKHVYPGLIDADSSMLLEDTASRGSGEVTTDVVDAIRAFAPYERADALGQGVTTVHVDAQPGSLFSGSGAVVKLATSGSTLDHVIASGRTIQVDLDSGSRPLQRLRNYETLRKAFADTKKYIEAWEEYDEKLEEYSKELEKLRKEEEKNATKKEGEKEGEKPGKGEAPKGEKKGEGDEPGEDPKPEDGPKPEDRPKPDRPPRPRPPRPDGGSLIAEIERLAEEGPPRGGRGGPSPRGGDQGGHEKNEKKKEEDKGPEKPKKPDADPEKDVLREVLEGKRLVRARARYAADCLNLLDLQKEFHFRLLVVGAAEAHHVAEELEARSIPVLFGISPGASDAEAATRPAQLEEASVTFAITSPGDNAAATRFLALGGAASVAGGLDADAALAAVTSRAAKILGVADRVGSLEVGKDGDLVIASAEPFSSLSVVEKVVIDGDVVFER